MDRWDIRFQRVRERSGLFPFDRGFIYNRLGYSDSMLSYQRICTIIRKIIKEASRDAYDSKFSTMPVEQREI